MKPSSETQAVDQTVTEMLDETQAPVYLIRPSLSLVEQFIDHAIANDSPRVHVFAADSVLKRLRDRFLYAAQAAELIDRDQLTLTTTVPDGWGTVIITETATHTVAQVAAHNLVFEPITVPTGLREKCVAHRESATGFSLRTPPWATVRTTFTEAFTPEICAEFETAIEQLVALDQSVIDETESALLVAAANELLLYDLSHWAEDISLCSNATFSRAKGELEQIGVVTTERVPQEIGRPRERLLLTDEMAGVSVAELVRQAQNRLA